jgi:CHAT domain-containing protein
MLPTYLFGYKSQIRLFLGVLLIFTTLSKSAAQNVTLLEKAEQFLQIGLIDSTEKLIHQGLELHANDPIHVARLYDLLGEVSKFTGDIDVALEQWNRAIEIRKKHLPANHPWQVWNYALLSNYYYEKIQPQSARIYADSCRQLLSTLSESDLISIKAHRIWNILAQSYKLNAWIFDINDFDTRYKIYLDVWAIYKQSLDFQQKHNSSAHDLNITKHLLANSYNDLAPGAFVANRAHLLGFRIVTIADSLYDHVISNWEQLYGKKSIQKARTLFVKAILMHTMPSKYFPNHLEQASQAYRAAIDSYNINLNDENAPLDHISNKTDLLMCLVNFTHNLLRESRVKNNPALIAEAAKVNHHAIQLWNFIHQSFQSENVNQLLSIYHLVPFKDSFLIEYEKKIQGLEASDDKMFQAVQYMRYFDLLKSKKINSKSALLVSLKDMQALLKEDEVFVDFVFTNVSGIHVAAVTKNSYKVFLAGQEVSEVATKLYDSLKSMEYEVYTTSALQLFQMIVEPALHPGIKRLIICPTDFLQEIPFEALLTKSPDQSKQNNFRNLPYLIHEYTVSYALTAAVYSNKQRLPFNMGLFVASTEETELADLPFARNFIEEIKGEIPELKVFKPHLPSDSIWKQPGILHISAHGFIKQNDAESAMLAIGKELLTLEKAYQMPVGAALVVLNTCNSSLGKKWTDDGIDGFARAIHQNGALAVLSNLWEVDDQASHSVLTEFYRFLYRGHSTEESLRMAKLTYLENCSTDKLAAPYYWSGHLITGNNLEFDVAEISLLSGWKWWHFVFLVIVLVIVLLILKYLKIL